MLRVALVDGDIAIRAGRRLMIDVQANLKLIFEEADAQVALTKIPDLLVDVIVIDQRLKGFDGLELSRRLVDAYSDAGESCPSIIITGAYATPELVISAIRSGASDVVTQDAPMSELLTSINNAGDSMSYADFSSFDEVLNHAEYRPSPDPLFVLRRSQLTSHFKDILELLDAGRNLEQVATVLKISKEALAESMIQLLVHLHFATFEQLYLALHDARSSQ